TVRPLDRQPCQPLAQKDRARPEESALYQDRLGRRLHDGGGIRNRMRLWPSNWWPRTLGAQLVAITAAAVLLSNVAVAAYFHLGQERQNESALVERLVDRAVSAATLMSAIPAKQRDAAAHALGSNIWQFKIVRGAPLKDTMSDDERALAARVRAILPKKRSGDDVLVKYGDVRNAPRLQNGDRPTQVIHVTV